MKDEDPTEGRAKRERRKRNIVLALPLGVVGLPIEELQGIIRDVPKPVIARHQISRASACT